RRFVKQQKHYHFPTLLWLHGRCRKQLSGVCHLMKHLIYILLFTLSFQTFSQETLEAVLAKFNNESVPYISVEQLEAKLQANGTILLDAREKEEFKVSHIKNALWVGFDTFSLEKTMKLLPNKN